MSKRVYIIHGWEGYPEEGWFPWLKEALEKEGFIVSVPQMPGADEPRIKNWLPFLQDLIQSPDEQTYLVGHSIGCQVIARYLESLPDDLKIGGAVFVAGFFKRLTNLEEDELTLNVVKEWLEAPLDLEKVKQHLNKSVAIFSDNDKYVSLDNQDDYRDKIGSKIIIESGKGHFSGENGIIELPSVLEALIDISN